jgi:hypothetical protein
MGIIKRLRVYSGTPEQAWKYMQFLYERREDDSQKAYTFKRIFYFNGLMTVLGQIEAVPEARDGLLKNLVCHIDACGQADGLESVLLALLFSAQVCENEQLVKAGTRSWLEYATKPSVSGTGPLLFYNVLTKRLYFFSARVGMDFLLKKNIEDVEAIVQDLERQALDCMIDPFNTPYSQMSWLNPMNDPSTIVVRAWTSNNRTIAQDVATFAAAAGAGVVFVATVPVSVPFCVAGVAAALLGTAAGVSLGILWNDVSNPPTTPTQQQPQPQPQPSSEVDAPADLPDTAADSNPSADDKGDLGTTVAAGDDSGDSGGDTGGGGCFSAATSIWMADSTLKSIVNITPADSVMAQSVGGITSCKVLKIHRQMVPETLLLTFEDKDPITTTPKQRFAIIQPTPLQLWEGNEIGRGSFVEARNLQVGNHLLPTSSRGKTVRLTKAEPVKESCEVFNLTVDTGHTYFVGDQMILVHNRKDAEPGFDDPV